MNRAEMQALWREAQRRQLLPANAEPPLDTPSQPWPVVLLTALGAWLAAVPLLLVAGLIFGPFFERGGAYIAGAALLAGAVLLLRNPSWPLFVEQLAVPLLFAGAGSLGFALFKDLREPMAPLVLALLAVAVGALVRSRGLQACLGAAAAFLCALGFGSLDGTGWDTRGWWGWHLCAALWLLLGLWERSAGFVRSTAWLAMATGWAAMSLLGLALSSGLAMLVGASLGGLVGGSSQAGLGLAGWPGGVSAALALLAAGWLGGACPPLRRVGYAGVALVLAGLAAVMPMLGATLLLAAACCVQGCWRVAVAAALAALWIVSSFYYQLAWPLATKAEFLAAAGVLLGLLVWPLVGRLWHRAGTAVSPPAPGGRALRVGAVLTLLAVLAVVNAGIAQKEALIAEGQTVFVPLAPADPRSLMQGDFMRLNFALPDGLRGNTGPLLTGHHPQVVARLDKRRVAQLVRLHAGEPLEPGELLIDLIPRNGRWTLVTDAWFFKEGEAQRWAPARFGEFRVKPGGEALLVGLRGDALVRL